MPMMSRLSLIAYKEESTLGTYEALAAADSTERWMEKSVEIVRPGVEIDNQGGLGVQQVVAGDAHTTAKVRGYIAGIGTGATAPQWFRLLKASGMSLTTATMSTTDTVANWKAISAGFYHDGRLFKARGLMGNPVFTFTAGKQVELAWDGMGGYVETPSDTSILSPTYNTTRPPVWAGTASLAVNSSATATRVRTLTLDLGNEVALREDPNSAGGYLCGWIGNRKPKVTMDPEANLVAVRCYHAAQAAGTEFDIVLTVGSVAGNEFIFTLNNCVVGDNPTVGDRDGKIVDNVGMIATGGITIEAV